MNSIFYPLIALFFTIGLNSCNDEVQPNPGTGGGDPALTVEIMALGDSRVEGAESFDSYRYELWKNLVSNDWAVNFIGNYIDPLTYPEVNGMTFDPDHQGVGGEVTAGLLNQLQTQSFTLNPDVALLGIGGNDIAEASNTPEGAVANIISIIGQLRQLNPNVTIIVEKIAPGTTQFMSSNNLDPVWADFNQRVDDMVATLTATESPVVVVDMGVDWTDSYMADDVHYNAAGAKVVADRYYDAIVANVTKQ